MPVTTLHNRPSDDAIVVATLAKLQKASNESATKQGEMRSAFSKAEADGLNLTAAKTCLKVLKKGPDAVKAFIDETTNAIHYLKLCGHELTKEQLELFSFTDSTSAPLEERAYENGLASGRLGKNQGENPHDMNTATGQKWMEGWHQGSKDYRAVMAMEPAAGESSDIIKGQEKSSDVDVFNSTLQEGEEG